MFPSITIGRIRGVPLKLHLLFVVMVVFLLASEWNLTTFPVPFLDKLILLGILFGSTVFHELGHATIAQRQGIQVVDIIIWPLGGMSRFKKFPKDPSKELPISLGGIGVNFGISLLCLPLLYLDLGISSSEKLYLYIQILFWVNLMLGAFNLIPAFPMDGGRVLRALLAFRMDYLKATEIAARVGKYLAWSSMIAAFFVETGGVFLFILGLFVWFSGTQELWGARLREVQAGGNPFSFFFGGKTKGTPPPASPPPRQTDSTEKQLEEFKGPLSEFLKKEKDRDDS